MTGFQRTCLTAAERALGRFGLRPLCEIEPTTRFELREPGGGGPCIRMRFAAAQHACEVFLYPDELSIRCLGYLYVPEIESDPAAALDRTLTDLLDGCASGLGPEPALRRAAARRARPRTTDPRYPRRAPDPSA